jgi:hypothetical protein
MSENKTQPTDASVDDYLAAIEDETRRADCQALCMIMTKATKLKPRMWGASMVGFGSYHYRYESGREGDIFIVGFSSRKTDISVYGLVCGTESQELLGQLGKHKLGKACLYIRKMADIDETILKKLVQAAIKHHESATDE